MNLVIRDVEPSSDLDLVAWTQIEATRSGRPIGFYDIAFPGPDEPRHSIVAEIASTGRPHFAHVSGFLVAEIDGVPVGAASGYAPGIKKVGHYAEAMGRVLVRRGWSKAHIDLLGFRVAPCSATFSDAPDDRWIVEWVALRPEARGKGAAAELLRAVLDRGRAAGFRTAQISYLIGNTPAQRAYERVGFETEDEKRDKTFEAMIGSPGCVRMRMAL
jgi:translation initiation factor 4G